MLKVVEKEIMKQMDAYTLKKKGINEVTLIHHVAEALYKTIKESLKKDGLGICFAGLGNNGADASNLCDILHKQGYNIRLFIVGNTEALSNAHATILSTIDTPYVWLIDSHSLDQVKVLLKQADYIIDGLFGTGLNKPVSGIYKDLISVINQSNQTIYSIDIASGIDANSGLVKGVAVHATKTLAIQMAKFGYYLNDGLDYTGKVEIIDVGIVHNHTHKHYEVIDETLNPSLLIRKHNSHKYDYGNIALFGGSSGLMGALNLSALAAYKLGAGLVSTYTLKKYMPYYIKQHDEVINHVYERINQLDLDKTHVIAFGMGLSKKDHHTKRLHELLSLNKPLIIDADGLHYFNPNDAHKNTIITPHIGEFTRLINVNKEVFNHNPIKHIKEFMKTFKGILLLKGPSTIIAKDKEIVIMPYGDASLARAGTGDVLSGMIASLIGQQIELFEAAKTASIIHARAAKIAKEEFTVLSILASDIINTIPKAIKSLLREKV